jgi:uncharacterized protein (TIGR02466 family)
MNFDLWFPTVTAVHNISDSVRISVTDKINAWIASGEHEKYLELCKEDNLATSYFKYHDTMGDLELLNLKDELLDCAVLYSKQLGLTVDKQQLQLDSWINFFYPGQSEQQHNHYGNFISGVYYVTAPTNTGVYRFYDPAAQKTMWKGIYLKNAEPMITNHSSGQYQPEIGKTIMFPSWLEHAVMANKSDDIRISIAYNITLKE